MVAKLCYANKQHFARHDFQTHNMESRSINAVFAANLSRLMSAKGWSQSVLAEKSGVAQRSISNYLSPSRRDRGASGKEPSAKLTEMSMISSALGIDAWEMLIERDASAATQQSTGQAELVALFVDLPAQAKLTLIENARLLHQATRPIPEDTNKKRENAALEIGAETKAA
jgi:transcriptional regulator with XRE-family HTH domain